MCGIFGLAARGDQLPPCDLASAINSMTHRGPDDYGVKTIVAEKPRHVQVALGSRRLAILDLSPSGHQPMSDPETGNWIVFNGEIYNFNQVRSHLESLGKHFTSRSDTEVILKAYAAWGPECLREFRGMFAFAIWDTALGRLFLARDRLGVKPLYYSEARNHIVFASEVRTLLQTDLVRKRLDPISVSNYLQFGSVYDPHTLIENVYSLDAGCYALWDPELRIVPYWDVIPPECPLPAKDFATKDQLDQLREILSESVTLRLVSDVPVGVFLSGGIDSSAIVALAAQKMGSAVNTFSVVFKEQDYSEARFSRMVAERFRTEHHEIFLSQEDAFGSVPDAICAMDQPTMDGINTFVVSQAVRKAGLKVVLSGLGGDEAFCGYSTFKTIPRMMELSNGCDHFPLFVRKSMAGALRLLLPRSDRTSKLSQLVSGNGDALHPYALARMLFLPSERRGLLKTNENEFASRANASVLGSINQCRSLDSVNQVSYLELRNYMKNTLLRDTDFMSMAHGLEVRVPLLDHKLIEFLFRIGGAAKTNKNIPKPLLVRATEDLLPKEIVERHKQGFVLPFEHWLRDQFRGELDKCFSQFGNGPLQEHIDYRAANRCWQSFLHGRTSWSRPWALYVLDRWCALHL